MCEMLGDERRRKVPKVRCSAVSQDQQMCWDGSKFDVRGMVFQLDNKVQCSIEAGMN